MTTTSLGVQPSGSGHYRMQRMRTAAIAAFTMMALDLARPYNVRSRSVETPAGANGRTPPERKTSF